MEAISPTEEEAEELVRLGHFHNRREESQELALTRLQDAVTDRSPELPLWLSTCARLRAFGARNLVRGLLLTAFDDWPDEVTGAATDALRAVSPQEHWIEDALLLEELAGAWYGRDNDIAARALMGAIVLVGPNAYPMLLRRMRVWNAHDLDLAIGVVTKQLAALPIQESPAVAELREAAIALANRTDPSTSLDDAAAVATTVELVAASTSPANLVETAGFLAAKFTEHLGLVRTGVTSALQLLVRDHGEAAIGDIAAQPGGADVLCAISTAPNTWR